MSDEQVTQERLTRAVQIRSARVSLTALGFLFFFIALVAWLVTGSAYGHESQVSGGPISLWVWFGFLIAILLTVVSGASFVLALAAREFEDPVAIARHDAQARLDRPANANTTAWPVPPKQKPAN